MGNYHGVTFHTWAAGDRVPLVRVTREGDDSIWYMEPDLWTAFLLYPSQSQDQIWENLKSKESARASG